jgi:hypothetical protein
VCPCKVLWVGVRTTRTRVREDEQRPHGALQGCNWVCSAITLRVKRCVEEIFNIDNKLLRSKSGQLPDLG